MSDLLANRIRETLVVARRLWAEAEDAEEKARLWLAVNRLEHALGAVVGVE